VPSAVFPTIFHLYIAVTDTRPAAI